MRVSIEELIRCRLAAQMIATTSQASALSMLEFMGAIQGQDYYGSLWAIGLRTRLTLREVIEAIDTYDIVRTWPQRGTLHFVPALDAKWMVGLSEERLIRGARLRQERLGLTPEIFEQARAVMIDALQQAVSLSRPEVIGLLEGAGIGTDSGRGYHILWYLAQTGVIIIGPMRDKQPTYALLDRQLPMSHNITRSAAINLLVQRYFSSHGPATVRDFIWWSGLTSKDAKSGLEANTSTLKRIVVDEKVYWMSKNTQTNQAEKQSAYLLPGFDEYVLGYKDRTMLAPVHHMAKIVPGNNGMFLPTIVINGHIRGIWKRAIKKDRVVVTLDPFEPLTASELKLIKMPLAQYGLFLGLKPEIELISVEK